MSQPSLAAAPPSEELAILVHGTFAGAESHTGDKWWQEGSEVSQALQDRLPDGVRIAADEEVFHWSGENGERARSRAASQLLQRLRPLEEEGKPYHLVGHSHGGSVIWMALRMSLVAGKPLNGLRSWTTVGTPFLHQSSRSPWHPINLLSFLVGLALLRPAFAAAKGLLTLLFDAAAGHPIAITLKDSSEAGYMSILRAPFLALLERMGVSVERTEAGIHLGSFDPAGDLSLLQYLLFTREGLLLFGVILLFGYICLHLSLMAVRPAIESIRIRAEKRLQRKAFARYGGRWLGLWSPDDEAINGLRATLKLSVSFVKRIAPSDRVFLTDNLELVSRPYYWVFGPVFNHLLRPVVDSLVRGVLARSAQGNDRPTTQVVDVKPTPVDDAPGAMPLPPSVQKEILDESNRHAGGVAPLLRQLLACPTFSTGLESISNQLSGRELVHTSYFDHPDVLDLISCNVALESGAESPAAAELPGRPAIVEWFSAFKRGVAEDDLEGSRIFAYAAQPEAIPEPPRRRAG
ncbi:hypothetical protein KOR34_27450 [Posidoniimonas corsicana]|uniref:Alpha/beta hydrolase family protein n=1 Tax=Posidoniimonas corsicana TaxID=1938618 RepID=A0A5C5VJ98_9BACT|nr:hypothetical protein [Posidoniimonas corsicana]TWT37782.1 hypothetical protein KOR34_27450 [Posidoniimonas corsicana]